MLTITSAAHVSVTGSAAFPCGSFTISISNVYASGPHVAVFRGSVHMKDFSGTIDKAVAAALRYCKRLDNAAHNRDF